MRKARSNDDKELIRRTRRFEEVAASVAGPSARRSTVVVVREETPCLPRGDGAEVVVDERAAALAHARTRRQSIDMTRPAPTYSQLMQPRRKSVDTQRPPSAKEPEGQRSPLPTPTLSLSTVSTAKRATSSLARSASNPVGNQEEEDDGDDETSEEDDDEDDEVEEVVFQRKQFEDESSVPVAELCRNTRLVRLSINQCRLRAVPKRLAMLTTLVSLDLSQNDLRSVPEAVAALVNLRSLELSANQLTRFPASVLLLPSLENLSLSGNRISRLVADDAQPQAPALNTLQQLNLSSNQLRAFPAAFLVRLRALRVLSLNHNAFEPQSVPTDTLGEPGALAKLERLIMVKCALTVVPGFMYELPALTTLVLDENDISHFGDPLARLPQMACLATLSLSSNLFRALPDQLCALTSLTTLVLTHNRIARLPENIGALSQLTRLEASTNRLTALPSSFARLAELRHLDLSYNMLADAAPEHPLSTVLSSLTSLQTCHLNGNGFDALLPDVARALPADCCAEPDPPCEIVPRVLYLGSYRSSHCYFALRAAGVTNIITVAASLEPIYPDHFTYHIIQIDDTPSAVILPHLYDCIRCINETRERGEATFVHCAAGISRSATVAIAYVMVMQGLSVRDAYDYVRARRPAIAPNENFLQQLYQLDEQIHHQKCCVM